MTLRTASRILDWLARAMRWGGFCLIGMAGAWALNLAYLIATNSDRPLVLEDTTELDGTAQYGGTLEIANTVVREFDCTGIVERWLRRPLVQDGKPMIRHGQPVEEKVLVLASGPPPVPLHRRVTYVLAMQLPLSVTPGTWHYWTRSWSDCRWGSQLLATVLGRRQYETVGEGAAITITDPTPTSPVSVPVPAAPITLLPERVGP